MMELTQKYILLNISKFSGLFLEENLNLFNDNFVVCGSFLIEVILSLFPLKYLYLTNNN